MIKPDAPEFERNLGFFSVEEQQAINNAVVAIAGAGGDGGMLALQLARLGVGEIRLADPDPFEVQNINRQAACTTNTLDVNKAIAVGNYIHEINPDITISTFTDGVTQDNVRDFLGGANLLIDETEFTTHEVGVMVARQARQLDIPNLQAMNIGFGTQVTSFHPKGKTFEKMLGLPEDMPLDEIADQEVSLSRWLAYLPPYGDIDVFKKIAKGEKSAPSVAPGVAIAAGTAAVQAILHIVGPVGNRRPRPVLAPKSLIFDAMTGESRLIKHPLASHYKYLSKLLIRNQFSLNPKVDY